MRNYISVSLVIICLNYSSLAQNNSTSVINSTGGSFEKGNITYEWSIGELALVNQMESSNGKLIITNGFLQSANLNVTPFNWLLFTDNEIHILPNPTKDDIAVQLRLGNAGRLKLILFNDLGIVIYKGDVSLSASESYQKIRMKYLSDGNYFLSVEFIPADLLSPVKKRSYKIIKIQ